MVKHFLAIQHSMCCKFLVLILSNMTSILKSFQNGHAAFNSTNPYAVDVIKTKRRDLIYGIAHTENLLDLLVMEGAFTAAKRSIVLTIRTREEQNSRVLDILMAKGERACRKFFHPCLMLAEPALYQRIKAYVNSTSESIRDTRRQLIGYLLERDKDGLDNLQYPSFTQKTYNSFTNKESKRSKTQKQDRGSDSNLQKGNLKPVQLKTGYIFKMVAAGEDLAKLEELLEVTDSNTVNSLNETLLHVAAEHGHLNMIELLLRKGTKLDLVDSDGRTALHRAASRGHTESVRVLIKAGAPFYARDMQSKTPIHLAASGAHLKTVQSLVEEESTYLRNEAQDTFLHITAMEDDWRLAELLLKSGAAVDARNSQNNTPLFHAVTCNNEKTVRLLLDAGAEVDSAVVNEAIKLRHVSILHILLAHGSKAIFAEPLDSGLFLAVRMNQEGAIRALIDSGVDVNMHDKQGYTPLLLSAELGHIEAFRTLAENQARLDATLPDLSSPTHLAVKIGSAAIVESLLQKGCNPNTTGPNAYMPLHLAARDNRSTITGLLLKAGAQANAVSQDGLTPLHIASQQAHAETVRELLQGKADPGATDRHGRTALHWAASAQAESPVVDLLLSAGANPNTTDKEKKSPLHVAAMDGNVNAVKSLLAFKGRGRAKDMNGSTPLHYAAASGHTEVVTALLNTLKKKDADERNVWRKTPLHAAAEKGCDGVIELLLGAGANINAMDNSKDTPLHCAARAGHLQAVKKLVNWGPAGQEKVQLQTTNSVGKTPLQVAESNDTSVHQEVATLIKRKLFLIK